jgi:SAM-dependent methyltransferase
MNAHWILWLIEQAHRLRPSLTPHLHGLYLKGCKRGWFQHSAKQAFTHIHRVNAWNSTESASGPGSSLTETEAIRQALPSLFENYGIQSLLDLPCGDHNWMQTVVLKQVRYIGADIVPELIAANKQYERPHLSFQVLDLISDPLPVVDLVLIRDCLVHFSHADVVAALNNVVRSGSTYLLTTTYPETPTNVDIITGAWQKRNLQAPPFHFPVPLLYLQEYPLGTPQSNKTLALWKIADLKPLL